MRVKRAQFRGTVERHAEAMALLERPGDFALVVRGIPRMLVFSCPDGCGDVLPVNLDDRADKAWRFYQRKGVSTLYPSVWREEGCGAHFILWDDVIYWNRLSNRRSVPDDLKNMIRQKLKSDDFQPIFAIAAALNQIPWAVHVACLELVRKGIAQEGVGKQQGHFKLRY